MTQTIYCKESGKSESYHFNLSDHSQKRSSQRGFNNQLILDVLDYGDAIFKQGVVFYVIKNNSLPANMSPNKKERLKNMVVVVSPWDAKVITCYKNKNGVKDVKRKSKRNLKASYC